MANTFNAITTGTGGISTTGDASGTFAFTKDGGSALVTISGTGAMTLGAPLPIASGGTNSAATPTNGGVVYGDGSAHQVTAAGSSGQFLQSNGASAPSWVAAPAGYAGPRLTIFNASSTWTVPTGITQVVVMVIGGGGGGNYVYGSNGGWGGVAYASVTGLTSGASITITVGAGGAGANSGASSPSGASSSFGTYVTATGGTGGSSSAPSSTGARGTASVSGASLILNPAFGATGNGLTGLAGYFSAAYNSSVIPLGTTAAQTWTTTSTFLPGLGGTYFGGSPANSSGGSSGVVIIYY